MNIYSHVIQITQGKTRIFIWTQPGAAKILAKQEKWTDPNENEPNCSYRQMRQNTNVPDDLYHENWVTLFRKGNCRTGSTFLKIGSHGINRDAKNSIIISTKSQWWERGQHLALVHSLLSLLWRVKFIMNFYSWRMAIQVDYCQRQRWTIPSIKENWWSWWCSFTNT